MKRIGLAAIVWVTGIAAAPADSVALPESLYCRGSTEEIVSSLQARFDTLTSLWAVKAFLREELVSFMACFTAMRDGHGVSR